MKGSSMTMMRSTISGCLLLALLCISSAASAFDQPIEAQIVTSSAQLDLTTDQHAIGLMHEQQPAAQTIILPPGARGGYVVVIDDLFGNLTNFPVKIVARPGETIVGRPSFTMNRNFSHVVFRLYASGSRRIWSAAQ
jgi:hypothetical protein